MDRSITTSGLGSKETLLIKSYLSLLPGKTTEAWTYRDSGPVDVEILAGGQPQASSKVVIGFGDGVDAELSLKMPIRVANVIAVLDAASSKLEETTRMTPALTQAPQASSVAVPSADDTALASLLRSPRLRLPQYVLSDGTTWIEVDTQTRRYRSTHTLTAAHASQSGWYLGEAPLAGYAVEGPLTYLQWMAGVAEARVEPGHYKLSRWPDFGKLPHPPTFLRLAAYFARTGGSPMSAASAALVPMPDVEAFLGGCVLAGYATRQDDGTSGVVSAAPPVGNAGMRGLLDRMRRRLGL